MADVRIPYGFERELRDHPHVVHAARTRAQRIARAARALARAEAYATGAYHDSIRTDPNATRDGAPIGRVQATDFKSHWIEFGYTRHGREYPPRAVLRRAAEASGLSTE